MRSATILKTIANPSVALYRGEGYWYFIYDDGGERYESYSVYTMRLSDSPAERWVEIGRQFAADVEAGTYGPTCYY